MNVRKCAKSMDLLMPSLNENKAEVNDDEQHGDGFPLRQF